ncbi:MAG: mechanosensitive ion channel family protein [Nitriliruptoraceae bacterium]
MTAATAFAAETSENITPDLFSDVDRPLTQWLDQYTDSPLMLWASDNLLEPFLRIGVILLLASVALRFIRRALRRAVERAQDPDTFAAHRLRAKMKLLGESEPTFSLRRAQRAESLGALAASVAGFAVWILALFMILGTFGLNLGPLIAGAGIIGVALGFGAQSLVKDFLSGVAMLLEDQYGVGDIIDVGEAAGVVERVTLRTTQIRDVTGTLWHIPNGEIQRIGNMSQEWARALLDIGVSYGTDTDAASELILQVASAMASEEPYTEDLIDEPEIWGVQALNDSSVDIRLVVKTQPGKQWAIARELRRRIKIALDAAQIEIPFPQRTVWLRTEAPVAVGDADTPLFAGGVVDESVIADAAAAAQAIPAEATTDPDKQAPEP